MYLSILGLKLIHVSKRSPWSIGALFYLCHCCLQSSLTLKRKYHFDQIFVTGCTGSCRFDNFQCSQWQKSGQKDISVSVYIESCYYEAWLQFTFSCVVFISSLLLLMECSREPGSTQSFYVVKYCVGIPVRLSALESPFHGVVTQGGWLGDRNQCRWESTQPGGWNIEYLTLWSHHSNLSKILAIVYPQGRSMECLLWV